MKYLYTISYLLSNMFFLLFLGALLDTSVMLLGKNPDQIVLEGKKSLVKCNLYKRPVIIAPAEEYQKTTQSQNSKKNVDELIINGQIYVPRNKGGYKRYVPLNDLLRLSPRRLPEPSAEEKYILSLSTRDMTLDQLRQGYALDIKYPHATNKDLVIKYMERILTLSKDQKEIQIMRFDLAQKYFDQGDMKKAAELFKEYVSLYPGDKKRCDKARYMEIASRFHSRRLPPRDQSCTQEVLKLANLYIDMAQEQTRSFIKEVQEIRYACLDNLFTHEYSVLEHYIIRKQYTGAHTRLAYIKEHILPHIKEKEPLVLESEILLAQLTSPNQTPREVIEDMKRLKNTWPEFKPTLIVYHGSEKTPPFNYKKS